MKVAEVMSRGVDPVDPSASVQQAAMQMAELDVGAVMVGTEAGLEGVLTDRDIILRLVVDGRNPAEVEVRDVMSSTLFTCKADDSVEDVFAIMRERQVRRLPVYDGDVPVGIVTMSDLAKSISTEAEPEQVKEALRDISEPHRQRHEAEEPAAPPSGEMAHAEAEARATEARLS
jgi:CBS domain-containing protein